MNLTMNYYVSREALRRHVKMADEEMGDFRVSAETEINQRMNVTVPGINVVAHLVPKLKNGASEYYSFSGDTDTEPDLNVVLEVVKEGCLAALEHISTQRIVVRSSTGDVIYAHPKAPLNFFINGVPFDIFPSLAVKSHSPTGFSWGYFGSGPSQLALAILLVLTSKKDALRLYHDFKFKFLGDTPGEKEFILPLETVTGWLRDNGVDVIKNLPTPVIH